MINIKPDCDYNFFASIIKSFQDKKLFFGNITMKCNLYDNLSRSHVLTSADSLTVCTKNITSVLFGLYRNALKMNLKTLQINCSKFGLLSSRCKDFWMLFPVKWLLNLHAVFFYFIFCF